MTPKHATPFVYRQELKNAPEFNEISIIMHEFYLTVYYRVCLFPAWQISAGPTLLRGFIMQSQGYHHCDRLSSYRHRQLNLPDTRRTTQRWQSVGSNGGGRGRRGGGIKKLKKEKKNSAKRILVNVVMNIWIFCSLYEREIIFVYREDHPEYVIQDSEEK